MTKTAGVQDSALNQPYKFMVLIEGGVEAPDEETVRAMCLSNVSFSAGFGQMVSGIRVVAREQTDDDLRRAEAAKHGIILTK